MILSSIVGNQLELIADKDMKNVVRDGMLVDIKVLLVKVLALSVAKVDIFTIY